MCKDWSSPRDFFFKKESKIFPSILSVGFRVSKMHKKKEKKKKTKKKKTKKTKKKKKRSLSFFVLYLLHTKGS